MSLSETFIFISPSTSSPYYSFFHLILLAFYFSAIALSPEVFIAISPGMTLFSSLKHDGPRGHLHSVGFSQQTFFISVFLLDLLHVFTLRLFKVDQSVERELSSLNFNCYGHE